MVARGIPPEARRHQARVVVDVPAAQLMERLGPWIGTIEPLDDDVVRAHDRRRARRGAGGLPGPARRGLPGQRAAGARRSVAGAGGTVRGGNGLISPFAWTFAQVSLSVSVRLNTSAPGRESGSGAK